VTAISKTLPNGSLWAHFFSRPRICGTCYESLGKTRVALVPPERRSWTRRVAQLAFARFVRDVIETAAADHRPLGHDGAATGYNYDAVTYRASATTLTASQG